MLGKELDTAGLYRDSASPTWMIRPTLREGAQEYRTFRVACQRFQAQKWGILPINFYPMYNT
jgi:hypothetical protein